MKIETCGQGLCSGSIIVHLNFQSLFVLGWLSASLIRRLASLNTSLVLGVVPTNEMAAKPSLFFSMASRSFCVSAYPFSRTLVVASPLSLFACMPRDSRFG